jgi:hypothetical protein
MFYRTVWGCAILIIATLIPASAQTAGSTVPKAPRDPLQAVTKPLTPKSPISASGGGSPVVPKVVTGSKNTALELNRAEQEQIAASAKPTRHAAYKIPAVKQEASPKSGSGINAVYKKPAANKN